MGMGRVEDCSSCYHGKEQRGGQDMGKVVCLTASLVDRHGCTKGDNKLGIG
jgi:hypothetical protein